DSNHDYVIFSLHGGAYVLGSAQMQRPLAYRIVKASKSKVFSINYRLAPQNPFPCALIDAVSGYMFLLQNYDPSKIVLTGESAGGGLALATLMAIRDMGLPLPAGAYCISPWCDLTHSFSSYDLNDSLDFLPPRVPDPRLQDRIHYYTTNENLKDPFVSPYWSKNLAGLPPLLITCGGVEKLVDEIIAFGEKAVKHDPNNRITLEVYKVQ
ncbi:Alpha/Beta hydrolase protein, partial [Globomyces pollinis-pini]